MVRILSRLRTLSLLALGFFVVCMVRFVSQWKLVRFGEVWSERLGHLVGNTECYLSEWDGTSYDIWCFRGPPSNKVIADKYRHQLHVWPAWLLKPVMLIDSLFKGWEKHIAASYQVDRDVCNKWRRPHLDFTKKELLEGKALLAKLGIPKGSHWVCLIARDSAYLKTHLPGDYSHHDFRDVDINDYMLAAKALVERGYYVIRMGWTVAKPVPIDHPMIIDYANSEHKSDLGALYLGAHCEFCIGTSCGFMSIPQVFKRPCAVTDFVPVEYISTFCKDRVIWKHHFREEREMTFQEIIASGAGKFLSAWKFERAGITLKNNAPEEIRDLAFEMIETRLDCQEDFWAAFPRSVSDYNGRPLHGKMLAQIGRKFLETSP